MERDTGADKTQPLVAIASLRNAIRITAVNAVAMRHKLTVGMPMADARARYPTLASADADDAADAALLKQLAEFCERYTPLVGLAPPAMLVLDISGCSHLFGGEAGLGRDLRTRLQAAGFTLNIAIASTVGCSAALAGIGKNCIITDGNEAQSLANLPFAALRLPPEMPELLGTFGLSRIGELYERPRAPLTARFGTELLTRLDQALGHLEEPISPLMPVQPYIAEQRFGEPISRDDDILGTIEQLAVQLTRMMERRQEGGRFFICDLFRVDGAITRLPVTTGKPLRDVRILRRLFTERLALMENLDPGFGFDLIRLSAANNEPLTAQQDNLDAATKAPPDLTSLIDRFTLRFGADSVLNLMPQERHIPEKATRAVAILDAEKPDDLPPPPPRQDALGPTRPIRLFAHPEPIDALAEVPDGPPLRFRWRRLVHDVAASEGPERIAPEWWIQPDKPMFLRDYFRIETRAGTRLWLYREGLYGRETITPHWFVHGLFA